MIEPRDHISDDERPGANFPLCCARSCSVGAEATCTQCEDLFCSDHVYRFTADAHNYCGPCLDIQQQSLNQSNDAQGTRDAIYRLAAIESEMRQSAMEQPGSEALLAAADVLMGAGVYLSAKLAYLTEVDYYRAVEAAARIEAPLVSGRMQHTLYVSQVGENPLASSVDHVFEILDRPRRHDLLIIRRGLEDGDLSPYMQALGRRVLVGGAR